MSAWLPGLRLLCRKIRNSVLVNSGKWVVFATIGTNRGCDFISNFAIVTDYPLIYGKRNPIRHYKAVQ